MNLTFVIIAAMVCLVAIAAAESRSSIPAFIYPVEHRGDVKVIHDRAALNDYELQVVPTDQNQEAVVEYNPADVSLMGLVWDSLPSPITAISVVFKSILSKIWKIAKFLLPVNLVLLGMALVVGFCAFTPYCTMIIQEPIASKIWAIRNSIPYMDELEYYANEAIYRVQELQGY